jgi:hypothetical protein
MRWVLQPVLLPALLLSALTAFGGAAPEAHGQGLSQRTLRELSRPAGPAPGMYFMRLPDMPEGFCFGQVRASGREDFFSMVRCGQDGTLIAVLPNPLRGPGAFTLRPAGAGAGSLRWCATVARDVVLGPAAIDVRNCQSPADARDECERGWHDQSFTFRQLGPRRFKIGTVNGECVAWREDLVARELAQLACQDSTEQVFDFIYQGPVTAPVDKACIAQHGWVDTPAGWVYAAPIAGVNFYGGDYANKLTLDDGGRECARLCVQDAPCRAFSWVRPGVQAAEAMCWLKNVIPAASADANTASGIVRP